MSYPGGPDSVSDVTVVVVVPGQAEPWKVSNVAFDLLIKAALPLVTQPADRQTLLQVQANHGLFLALRSSRWVSDAPG